MKAWVPLTHLQLTADLISSKPSLTLSDINLTQFKYPFMHTYFSLYCQKKRNIKKQNCNIIIILKINDNSLVSSASFFLDFIFNSFDFFFFFQMSWYSSVSGKTEESYLTGKLGSWSQIWSDSSKVFKDISLRSPTSLPGEKEAFRAGSACSLSPWPCPGRMVKFRVNF